MAGVVYGVRSLGLASAVVALVICLTASVVHAATYTTLVSFGGVKGAWSYAGLIADPAGNLYGTTSAGGSGGGSNGDGMVFKFAPATTALTMLAPFNGADGSYPYAGLIADADGNLYGTTLRGGANDDGAVFKFNPMTGVLTTLVSFNGSNGGSPYAGLIADADGNLYGTTYRGGMNNQGTVFKLDITTGALTTLVSFNGANSSNPYAGLVADSAGNLYGTTVGGRTGFGTVYKLNPVSGDLTTLVTFDGVNGRRPYAGLTADAAGNFYGTTGYGGTNGVGTVFKLDVGTGTLTTLASFDGANGRTPYAGLTVDVAGNLYGTTTYGGTYDRGTIFKVDATSNALTTLISFSTANGSYPYGSLIADPAGNLYGTTHSGAIGFGSVFKLTDAGFVTAVAPDLPGDFNSDGVVDAADYTMWRDTNGAAEQYEVWRTNYGEVAGNAVVTSPSEAVPEPTGVASLVMGAAVVVRVRRQRLIG
jgi:uncharacterized repeat protein (TIGR03803 family)